MIITSKLMHQRLFRSKPRHYWRNMRPHIRRGAQKHDVAFMRCVNISAWVGVFTLCFSISASQLEQYNLICFMLVAFEEFSSILNDSSSTAVIFSYTSRVAHLLLKDDHISNLVQQTTHILL